VKKLYWTLECAVFILLSLPFALLPRPLALRAGGGVGLLMFHLIGRRRRTAIEGILPSLPLLNYDTAGKSSEEAAREIARATFVNFGKSLVESWKLYYRLGQSIIDSVEIRGLEHYEAAKAKGKGVIFVTGHCGNWELMALSFGVLQDPLSVVARRQKNPVLNGVVERMRTKYGNGIIYKEGAVRQMMSLLRKRGVVGILIDQAAMPEEGYLIDFLGRKAWTTKMPALLARKTRVPVLPGFIHREGDRHVFEIHPEVELSTEESGDEGLVEDTRKLTGYVEEYARRYPTEWYWLHRRWKRAE
jgi:Kdo2-lipid IVA lauroyltransferase/acyltransferase